MVGLLSKILLERRPSTGRFRPKARQRSEAALQTANKEKFKFPSSPVISFIRCRSPGLLRHRTKSIGVALIFRNLLRTTFSLRLWRRVVLSSALGITATASLTLSFFCVVLVLARRSRRRRSVVHVDEGVAAAARRQSLLVCCCCSWRQQRTLRTSKYVLYRTEVFAKPLCIGCARALPKDIL